MAKTYSIRVSERSFETLRKLHFETRKSKLKLIDEALALLAKR